MRDIPSLRNLARRAEVLRALRRALDARGLLEVETPVRIPCPALETHIDAIPSGAAWLRTSPELHMKRLLAAGLTSIYQIGSCFRDGERGARHNPEFTMLEWYRAPGDYMLILDDCRLVLSEMAQALFGAPCIAIGARSIDLEGHWEHIPVREAYLRWAGWDPVRHWDADRFDEDMALRIEPALPRSRPVVLLDYPAPAAALARLKPGAPELAERWELYLNGVEVCNAFSELTDAAEQRRRFEQSARERRAAGREAYLIDEPFMAALEAGLPPCGGAAMGVDRVVMLCCDTTEIDEVRPFCPPIGGGDEQGACP